MSLFKLVSDRFPLKIKVCWNWLHNHVLFLHIHGIGRVNINNYLIRFSQISFFCKFPIELFKVHFKQNLIRYGNFSPISSPADVAYVTRFLICSQFFHCPMKKRYLHLNWFVDLNAITRCIILSILTGNYISTSNPCWQQKKQLCWIHLMRESHLSKKLILCFMFEPWRISKIGEYLLLIHPRCTCRKKYWIKRFLKISLYYLLHDFWILIYFWLSLIICYANKLTLLFPLLLVAFYRLQWTHYCFLECMRVKVPKGMPKTRFSYFLFNFSLMYPLLMHIEYFQVG